MLQLDSQLDFAVKLVYQIYNHKVLNPITVVTKKFLMFLLQYSMKFSRSNFFFANSLNQSPCSQQMVSLSVGIFIGWYLYLSSW